MLHELSTQTDIDCLDRQFHTGTTSVVPNCKDVNIGLQDVSRIIIPLKENRLVHYNTKCFRRYSTLHLLNEGELNPNACNA